MQDKWRLVVGLCRVFEGLPRCSDDLPVLGLLWYRAGNEQPAGHALPHLLPDEGLVGCSSGQLVWADEPLCTLPGWHQQRYALRQIRFPRPHLGAVPCALLRGYLSLLLRLRFQRATLVGGLDGAHLLLDLCADVRGHELWHCTLHEQAAACHRLCLGGCGWELGRCDRRLRVLQAYRRR